MRFIVVYRSICLFIEEESRRFQGLAAGGQAFCNFYGTGKVAGLAIVTDGIIFRTVVNLFRQGREHILDLGGVGGSNAIGGCDNPDIGALGRFIDEDIPVGEYGGRAVFVAVENIGIATDFLDAEGSSTCIFHDNIARFIGSGAAGELIQETAMPLFALGRIVAQRFIGKSSSVLQCKSGPMPVGILTPCGSTAPCPGRICISKSQI